MLQAVREQLKSKDTPFVKEHYDRLIEEGIPKKEVMEMLAGVLSADIWEMQVKGKEYNKTIYTQRLAMLPDMSWLDDGN